MHGMKSERGYVLECLAKEWHVLYSFVRRTLVVVEKNMVCLSLEPLQIRDIERHFNWMEFTQRLSVCARETVEVHSVVEASCTGKLGRIFLFLPTGSVLTNVRELTLRTVLLVGAHKAMYSTMFFFMISFWYALCGSSKKSYWYNLISCACFRGRTCLVGARQYQEKLKHKL